MKINVIFCRNTTKNTKKIQLKNGELLKKLILFNIKIHCCEGSGFLQFSSLLIDLDCLLSGVFLLNVKHSFLSLCVDYFHLKNSK
jgi:hypothetical protein